MADKNRVATTRPANRRGVTKGQIREERRERSRARARRKRSMLMFGGIIFALVFIAALVLTPSLGSQGSGLPGINTGGHIALDPDDGRDHIEGNVRYAGEYSVTPATSGPHWRGASTPAGIPAPARWGRYNGMIPDEVLIHNLEHGGIGLHYDCEDDCPDIVDGLEDIMPSNPSLYIMSPYNGLPGKVVITAWRHHLVLDEVDEEQILDFIEEYQARAPEFGPQNDY